MHQDRDDRLARPTSSTGSRTSATSRRRKELAKRFKDPNDPFKIVIVRDMWLTGFDVPCLHTMYVDKPMRGHGLMQAIARVNRVFRDKPGGLVVDYLGLADQLKQALATYTESGGQGKPSIDTERSRGRDAGEVRSLLRHDARLRLVEVDQPARRRSGWACCRRRRSTFWQQEDGKPRFTKAVTDLSRAFALCAAHDEAIAHTRRHGVLPGRAGRAGEAGRRAEDRRSNSTRPCGSWCRRPSRRPTR